jgi:hypothetical protein
MKMKKCFFISIVAFLLLNSCFNSNNYVFQGKITCKDIPIDIYNENIIYRNQIKDARFVKLETSDKCQIGEIRKLETTEDRVYILDSDIAESLFVFKKNGEFLFKVARKGQGPGEYFSINDFFIDTINKTIIIFDANIRNLHYYDWEGKFIRSHSLEKFWFFACCPLDSNTYALDFTKKALNNKYHLILVDENNEEYYKSKHLETDYELANNFHIAFYKGLNNNIYYTPTRCDTIFNVSSQGVQDGYRIDFGKQALPDRFYKKMRKEEQVKELLKSQYCYGIKNILETEEILFFNFSFGNNQLSCFYNKSTEDTYSDLLYHPTPKATDNNYFVGFYESYFINPVIKNEENREFVDEWKRYIGEENWNILQSMEDDDNPILVFYKLEI